MEFNLQAVLENETVLLLPLQQNDFDSLYSAANDPAIWQQHPNPDRWQKPVFENFFKGALQSKGAYKIIDKTSGEVIGSTRFYDYDSFAAQILIGYTFYKTAYWGTGINISVKKLMLEYAFRFVSQVRFHIGAENIRSQIAIARIGAIKIAEEQTAYYGEASKLNYLYMIMKSDWMAYKKK